MKQYKVRCFIDLLINAENAVKALEEAKDIITEDDEGLLSDECEYIVEEVW